MCASEQALAWQAGHDELTGLPNRSTLLRARPRAALDRSVSRGTRGGAAGPRPRRLQDGQRLPRPRDRRRAARARWPRGCRAGPARRRRRPAGRRPVRRPGPRAATPRRPTRWRSGCRRRSRLPFAADRHPRAAVGQHRRRRLAARRASIRTSCSATPTPRCSPRRAPGGTGCTCSRPALREAARWRLEVATRLRERRHRPARRPLPAGGAAGHRRGRGRRGAGALAAPRARPAAARRLPRRRRGDRAGHPDHPLAAARDDPPGGRVGRAGAARCGCR